MTVGRTASVLSAAPVGFTVPSGNINPVSLRNARTAYIPCLPSKLKGAASLSERKSIMDNKIEIFNNREFGNVRTFYDGERLLFCGSDVARALGYSRPNEAVARHAKGTLKQRILTNGGEQEMLFITEGDVYRLIVRSKLPAAERFERWLFDEVVPTIRKTGCYMTGSVLERIQKDPAFALVMAKAVLRERDRADALEAELNVARPKADYFDAFINPDDCTNIRTTAKELKIPERKFVKFLLNEGYLFRSPSGQLLPYNKKSNEGLFIVRDFVTFRYTGSQTYFTPKGKDVIRIRYFGICGVEVSTKMAG